MVVSAVAVQGDGFALTGASPAGSILNTGQNAPFAIQFRPASAGSFSGSLLIGDRLYSLRGTASAIPFPKPSLDLTKDGVARVVFDAPARTAEEGTIALEFRPLATGATDPAIQFCSGGRSAVFAFVAGDSQVEIPYAIGTTAGSLSFTAKLGSQPATASVTVAPAAVKVIETSGTRSANAIELRITGIDNTRTVAAVTYTFYDSGGNIVPPGALRVDSAGDFARFFAASDSGGNFQLRSTFPVSGDAARISAFEVEIVNSAGSAKTGRRNF
jgi:hypothetical protein